MIAFTNTQYKHKLFRTSISSLRYNYFKHHEQNLLTLYSDQLNKDSTHSLANKHFINSYSFNANLVYFLKYKTILFRQSVIQLMCVYIECFMYCVENFQIVENLFPTVFISYEI